MAKIMWAVMAALAVGLVDRADAGSLIIDSQQEWGEWIFPQGVLDLNEDGSVGLREFRRNIDAVADAPQFFHKDSAGNDVPGGVRGAGSNEEQAANVVDGDPDTWWAPSQADPLGNWWIEIDLGRLVQAKNIRLIFPDNDQAKPLREFAVYVSEGARQVIGKDVFQFNRIGGTTLPNEETQIDYRLFTVETGAAVGEHLVTIEKDTLDYLAVQYIRIIAQSHDPDVALADIEVEALGDNLALGLVQRGGSIRGGTDTQNISNLADGSAAKWWSGDGRGNVDWRESGTWQEWDLGATFWIDRLTMLEYPLGFATTGHSNSFQRFFQWQTSDGAPIPTKGEDTIQSPFDFQKLSFVDNELGTNTLKYDLDFPQRKARYLFYHHESGPFGFIYRIFEVFIYGAGHPAAVTMTSSFIDLEGTKSLRAVSWDADLPVGSSIEIRTRTGDEILDEVFYFDKNGTEIPESRWNKLPNSQKLPLVVVPKAGSDWSSWSPSYKLSGEAFRSPTPRKFVQLQVDLKTEDPQVAPRLRALQLDFDEPLVEGGIFAEVFPREAQLDSVMEFSVLLGPRAGLRDSGFDQVGFELPGTLEGEVRVRVGEDIVDAQAASLGGDTLLVSLPQLVQGDSVEVIMPVRLLDNASSFNGWVVSSDTPEIQQGIQPSQNNALTVYLPAVSSGGSLIRNLELTSNAFSPNGDGINDQLDLRLVVVKTQQPVEVEIYDLSGQALATFAQAGSTRFTWDGRDFQGNLVPPGIYILAAKVEADARTDRVQRIVNVVY